MKKSIIIIALIAAGIFISGKSVNPALECRRTVTYTVRQGDTLWAVASRYSGNAYMLEYLEELKSLPENKSVLNPHRFLQPGDKITVINYNTEE
jgi:nucleoid-associated protein YgaU